MDLFLTTSKLTPPVDQLSRNHTPIYGVTIGMTLHPITNAVAATLYIAVVALFLRYIESIRHDTPDTFIDSLGFLSLFTLSAAIMAFLFFYQPVRLLIEKKPREATAFLMMMIATFGLLTVMLLLLASMQ
jgi:hypothetical protein